MILLFQALMCTLGSSQQQQPSLYQGQEDIEEAIREELGSEYMLLE